MALAALGAAGCKRNDLPRAPAVHEVRPPPERRVVHSLVEEATRLELDQEGPVINLGTPDQHKYTRGYLETGWRRPGVVGQPGAEARSEAQLLLHDPRGGTRTVVLRVKGQSPRQRLLVQLDALPLGERPLTGGWQVVDYPVPAERPLGPGRRQVVLRFEPPSPGPAARVDWVWLRSSPVAGVPELAKVGIVNLGEPMRALVAGAGRRYAYHLHVPPRALLRLRYGADRATRFEIDAAWDGGRRRLLDRRAGDGKWHTAELSLAALAGRTVRLTFSSSGRSKRAGWGEPAITVPGNTPAPPVIGHERQAQNLIQIVMDTARSDLFAPFGARPPLRDGAVSRLATGAVSFTRAYSNASWTLPATATLLTGRYHFTFLNQRKLAQTEHGRIPDAVPLLSEHLLARGFATAAFVDNPIISEPYGFRRGWERYVNYAVDGNQVGAKRLLADALAWVERQSRGRRWFLYLHLNDPHAPYRFREGFTPPFVDGDYRGKVGRLFRLDAKDFAEPGRFDEADRRQVQGLYYGQVASMDHALGEFLARLAQSRVLDRSLVVLSNDHGEELFDHGGLDHGHTLYDELLRTPLVFRLPRRAALAPARIANLVELVDVAPTALELLGVAPIAGAHGESLVPLLAGETPVGTYAVAAAPWYGVRTEGYKLVTVAPGKDRLFDLQADPGEQRDVAGERPIALRAAEVLLYEGIGGPTKQNRLTLLEGLPAYVAHETKLDPRHRRALEALGYINK